MPCRKPHRNSHHGCVQCKTRRVKCDQEQPSCARCRKKDRTCTYRHLTSSYDPFKNHNKASSTPVSSASPHATSSQRVFIKSNQTTGAFSPNGAHLTISSSNLSASSTQRSSTEGIIYPLYNELQILDSASQELLYHYDTEVSIIFTTSEVQVEVLSCLHDAVIRHSLAHPYVYHSILTVSALHLASLTTPLQTTSPVRSPHLVTALAHKASALEALRSTVMSMSGPTCEPALAASGLLTVCAFALLHAGMVSDIIDLLAQIIALYRGTVAIFRFGRQVLHTIPSGTIPRLRQSVVTATACETPWPEAEAAVDKVLAKVYELDEASKNARGKKYALINAGCKLKLALRRVAAARGVHNVACMWLAMVDSTFNESVKTREPLSLILVAHWVVTLRYVKHIWWVQGWPERTIQAVWQEAGEQYLDLMQWVFKEVRGEVRDEKDSLMAC
ncbi:hypothetical protein GGR53DRAFT_516333 [Hypoxylon sp. FL1150]|nr:hypothetical protein GGR53DRAFT_516333 [Hypoxylon sp. FL1150]